MRCKLPVTQTLLILDCASATVRVGIWQNSELLAYHEANNLALNAIFELTEQCINETRCPLSQIEGYIYNEGPGSMLGIRLAAMAIRTWQTLAKEGAKPIYVFQSTSLALNSVKQENSHLEQFCVLTDHRQGHYMMVTPQDVTPQLIKAESIDNITLPIYYFPQRKTWATPPTCRHYY